MPSTVTKRVAWSDMHSLPKNPILETRLKRIMANGGYDPTAVGTPQVALNDNGAFPGLPKDALVLIDGHHRKELAKRANGSAPKDVICLVHRGLTREQIEEQFLKANDTRNHHVNELFVHRVLSGERQAVQINNIIEAAGFQISESSSQARLNYITGANAPEWVFNGGRGRATSKIHPVALTRTLEGLGVMYPKDREHGKSNLIKGLGLFHLRYGNAVDLGLLHERVSEKYPSVRSLLTQALLIQEALGLQVPQALGHSITAAYNKRKNAKSNLPDWR